MLKRWWVGCVVSLAAAAVANASPRNLDWVDLNTNGGPLPGDPLLWTAASPPASPQNGDAFFFMIDNGANTDTNGGDTTHFDPEGVSFGSFRGQAWVRWDGLQSRLKSQCDTAFGTNAWTVRRIWVVYSPTTLTFGTGPGVLSFAETSDLNAQTMSADFGDTTQTVVEVGGNPATHLPAGYRGFYCVATYNPPPATPAMFQSFLIMDDQSGSVQPLPGSSLAFRKFTVGAASSILPIQPSFTIFNAPVNDFVGGQGETVALSFSGFLGTFAGQFSPCLLFEVVKQPPVASDNFPSANNLSGEVAFSATAGTFCDFTLTASDLDLGDTLTFTITNPGDLGGTLAATGPVTSDGLGNRTLPVRYTIPSNVHGNETFDVRVSDGIVTVPATAKFAIRDRAVRNSIAFGANTSDPFDSMRIYTGGPAINGGTNGRLDRLLGPPFAQSVEFDNYNGFRHNPDGNLLGVDFGSTAGGGAIMVYATTPGCTGTTGSPQGYVAYRFDGSDPQHPLTRAVGISVSPNNGLIAIEGFDTHKLYILNYAVGANVGHGGATAAAISFNREIDMGNVWLTQTYNTKWLDNSHVFTLNFNGDLISVDINDPNPPSGAALVLGPYCPPVGTACPGPYRVASLEYNPELSPHVFITTSERTTATPAVITNRLWVANLTSLMPEPQSGGALFTDYSNAGLGTGDEEFREIGFDCFGNLFIGVAVNTTNLINIKFLANATNVAGIAGGYSSLNTWRTVSSELQSGFSGLDVAARTTIGAPAGPCGSAPPVALASVSATVVGTPCVVTLTATNAELAETLTFSVTNPGPNNGMLIPTAAPAVQSGTTWTKTATYTPAAGFRGEECFSFKANDGVQDSGSVTACMRPRGSVSRDTVVFGASKNDTNAANRSVLAYYGNHTPGGGTAGASDFYGSLTGASFTQGVEFDNYNNIAHNPNGNLLGLNFGTSAALGGGAINVFATRAACSGNEGTVLYVFDGNAGRPRNRTSGLSVSPDNTTLALYGADTPAIYFAQYTTGANVGFGGTGAATIGTVNTVGLSATQVGGTSTGVKSISTTWLDNNTIVYCDKVGALWTVTTGGTITQKITCPKTIISPNNFSFADVEYNPAISPYIFVSVGEFVSANPDQTTNTLYIVDPRPATWTIVRQSGNALFTNHSARTTGTFREIAFDSVGNLFVGSNSTPQDTTGGTNGTIIRYFPSAATYPGGITDNSSIVWMKVPVGTGLPTYNFSGLDIALGGTAPCTLPGDLNGDGTVDAGDIQLFTVCYIGANGGAPGVGCGCADMAAPSGALTGTDLSAFIAALLP